MNDDTRTVIADGSPDWRRGYEHLAPIVDAEVAWGNQAGKWHQDRDLTYWSVHMRAPLHLDQIRATFVLPPHITIVEKPERVAVVDERADVFICWVAPGPRETWGEALRITFSDMWGKGRRERKENERIAEQLRSRRLEH